MLLGISPDYLYLQNKSPKKLSDFHKPYFLVFCKDNNDINSSREKLIKKWENNKSEDNILSKIESIGDVETYRSFWDYGKLKKVFKVY